MRVRRWITGVVGPLTLLGLPACGGLIGVRPRPTDTPPQPVRVSHTAGQFGTLPKVPGQNISLNPATPPDHPPVPIEDPPADPPPAPPKEEITLPPLDAKDPLSPLARAIQTFHDGQPEKAVEYLDKFDKPNQELLLQLIPALVQASKIDLTRTGGEEPQVLARQFESAAATLAKRAGLSVRKATVCLAVDGFGLFTPVKDRSALVPDSRYWLYLEIGNVPSVPTVRKDGVEGYLTRLDCEMQVVDEFGKVVEIVDVKTGVPGAKSKSAKSEFTRSPIHDYFVAAVLHTPARPGAYTVTFEVRDPRTGQSVSKPIPFRVQ